MSSPSSTENPLAQLAAKRSYFLCFLRARVHDDQTAEDLLQSAFLRAHVHAASLQATEKTSAWFFRILRNAVIDHYRREDARQRALTSFASQPSPAIPDETTPCACVDGALRSLAPGYREALHAVDLNQTSVQAFADQLHTTANNVSVRLHRARKALHRKVVAICGACARQKCRSCTCTPGQL